MTISLVVDLPSVWIGVGVTLVVEFVTLVVLAGVQYSRSKRSSSISAGRRKL